MTQLPAAPTEQKVWRALEAVQDPEIPVVSVVELGIVRQVKVVGEAARITITPTFAGCPALAVMQSEIESRLRELGFEAVEVQVSYAQPWTSDWLGDEARAKLRAFGLSPPPRHGGAIELVLDDPAECPYCGSKDTARTNDFGSTLCRSIHVCRHCQQPFESFKPI